MKKYSIAFLVYAAVLCFAYYGSYRLTYGHYREETKEEMSHAGEAVMTDTAKEAILKSDTEYIIESYNRKTGQTEEIRSPIPMTLLGLNREETESYAAGYSDDPGIDELEAGFEHMELVAFSGDRVIFRKTYMPWEKEYKYSLGEADGCVVVYYLDNRTVYEYTDIPCDGLPGDIQSRIRNKTCRMDIHELYDFLENYSS